MYFPTQQVQQQAMETDILGITTLNIELYGFLRFLIIAPAFRAIRQFTRIVVRRFRFGPLWLRQNCIHLTKNAQG
jgi:hypothetical protein